MIVNLNSNNGAAKIKKSNSEKNGTIHLPAGAQGVAFSVIFKRDHITYKVFFVVVALPSRNKWSACHEFIFKTKWHDFTYYFAHIHNINTTFE